MRAYNPYDLYTESNLLTAPRRIVDEPESSAQVSGEDTDGAVQAAASVDQAAAGTKERPGTTTFRPAASESVEEEQEVSFLSFLKLCMVFVVLLFLVFFISQYFSYQRRRKRRRQRRKEAGSSRNQLK